MTLVGVPVGAAPQDGARRGSGLGARLGIAGGGQLARMTAQAAVRLGVEIAILERDPVSPAATLATHALVGDWSSLEGLRELAAHSDVVTFESEFVDAGVVVALEAEGVSVRPSAQALSLVQDKFRQKRALAGAGLPVPRYREVASAAEVHAAGVEWGWPVVLKRRRDGYDGRGNATIGGPDDVAPAWDRLGAAPVYLEAFCPYLTELATIVTRSHTGETAVYPVVETTQRNHVCHAVVAPAGVSAGVAARAAALAEEAVRAVGGTGSFGVELFLLPGGALLVNELAPRVHNSGHYTLEACVTSQFENHVRAVLGWPLGPTMMIAPAAAMVNLLGAAHGSGRPAGLEQALAVSGAHVHLYGKLTCSPGRKMGHVTRVKT
jgi:5-(carboxyamino)imidazole ribonucleotide synthase